MKQISLTILFTGIFFFSFGQEEKLSLQQAIEMGLQNNYSIIIARNESQMAKNDVSPGNAGMLPQLNLGLVQNNSLSDTKQTYSNGSEVNKNNAAAHSISATAALDWTLFDGLKMFVTYKRLKELQAMGELNARLAVENTVSDIISGYFDIVQQKALLDVIQTSKDISEIKLKIAKTKFEIGSSSKVEYLQAQVDFNADVSAYKKQLINIDAAKVRLNQLLAREVSTTFDVTDSIVINYNPTYADLQAKAEKDNAALMLARKDINLSKYYLRELRSERYPRLEFNTSYSYVKTNSQANFVLSNRTNGLNYGFTLSYNIFNGFTLNRNIKNARLGIENSQLNFSYTQSQISADLLVAFRNFQNDLELLKLEEDNSRIARENVDLSLERFRVGTIDELQLKEAQRSFTEAVTRLVGIQYETKVAESILKKLTGELLR